MGTKGDPIIRGKKKGVVCVFQKGFAFKKGWIGVVAGREKTNRGRVQG